MFIKSLFLLYLLLLIQFSETIHAQDAFITKKEVIRLLNSSDSCLYKSDYKNSLSYSSKALNFALIMEDNNLIARSYNTIAGNYEEIMEIDKALEYYDKSIKYFKKGKNDTLQGAVLNNIGNIYFYRKKAFDKAITYYNESISISQKYQDTISIVLTKLNFTLLYFESNDYKKGIEHLDYVEKHRRYIKIVEVESYLHILLGKKFTYLKQYDKADYNFKEAIRIGEMNNSKIYLSDSYNDYSKFLFETGKYKDAYVFMEKHVDLKNEIFDLEKIKNAKLIGMDIALGDKMRELSAINKEKELQAENLKKTKIIIFLFSVFLIVIVYLLYMLYRNNVFKKKVNEFLKTTNVELKEARDKAEEASKLKTQFISTISHELRTPLYGVVGITNMLSDEHKELVNSPHLKSLKFSARYLLTLVNDLLQVSKIEENKVVLENYTLNLEDEITIVSNSLSFIANQNKNQLVTYIDPNIPEYLVGDKLRLSQILMNLVSNALKFTQNGTITISAQLVEKEESRCSIKFEVADTGVGIAEKDLSKIFEKFVQIDRKEDDYQGAGLGLSIVKKLVMLFGSSITVKSKEGVGTQFTFTIVFDSDTTIVNEIINNIYVDLTSGKIYKVLVVEDNKINQMVTRKILDKSNYKSTIVDDGYAAIEAIGKEHFDVVLMDINMPLINGFDTTRLLRKKGHTLPIIALTAFAKDEITEEAKSVGINDILIKPFEASKLSEMIESLTN